MKFVCKCLGGSRGYGLETEKSDYDWRGVLLDTDIRSVIGLYKNELRAHQEDGIDESYTEFRHTLNLLRKANTQSIELLFTENWTEITPLWQEVIACRTRLIDSELLFSSLRGYILGERHAANGGKPGKLGAKRADAIAKYGFSPKNFVQLFRLSWAGITYFRTGVFPVRVTGELQQVLAKLKKFPEEFSVDKLNAEADRVDKALEEAYRARTMTTQFDIELANQFCVKAYGQLVSDEYAKLNFSLDGWRAKMIK